MDTHQSSGPKGGCPQFVIRDFSIRIMRGDRIGLLGPNGAGKTTLLRLLLGELAPDSGSIRVGTNVQPAYYDQQREQLDPEKTVLETVGAGNEVVTINGRSRHINGYLRDFLFAPERARSPVKALSGGERNRLLLARLFTRPANVLVLDEPTNDLDMETLDLLQELLADYAGTVLLVSHDRAFLTGFDRFWLLTDDLDVWELPDVELALTALADPAALTGVRLARRLSSAGPGPAPVTKARRGRSLPAGPAFPVRSAAGRARPTRSRRSGC